MIEHLYAVGQLLYATAICDSKMREVEEKNLKESFNYYIQVISSTGEDDADNLPKGDKILEDISLQKLSPPDYFENFKNHYHNHPEEFAAERKELIMKSINSIASSYAKQNKSEIILVAKTRLLLNPV